MLEKAGITKKKVEVLRECVKILTHNPELLKSPELDFLHNWNSQHAAETESHKKKLLGNQNKPTSDKKIVVEVYCTDDPSDTQRDDTNNRIKAEVKKSFNKPNSSTINHQQDNEHKQGFKSCKLNRQSFKEDADLQEPKPKQPKLSVGDNQHKSIKKTDEMKPFQCRFCYKHFKSIQGLDSHVNRHIEKNVYVCSICSKQYFHETSLRSHLEAKKCSRQNKSYNRFAKYDAKTDVYNFLGYIYYTEALQCKHCKKVFCSEKKYFKHEKKHKKPFGCNECRTSFLNAKKLRSHYVSHHIFQ